MQPGSYWTVSPGQKVITALIPFVAASLLRLMYGRSRTTEVLLTIGTSWFLVNVLITPFEAEIQRVLYAIFHF